jgi:catechol 2,3-dioxygenase-like lactoylglutathione lyase family enzyme
MFNGIDHIVIAVPELDAAIRSYGDAGFTVVRGGRHNIGTHNALIAFADGAYLELIAFLNPIPGHPWHAALEHGGGIVDFCMQTDDLAGDVDLLRRAGTAMNDPNPMTRDRPDGFRVAWVLATPRPPFNGQVPFLIRDETARDERVPRERTHRNGITGIASITIAVADVGAASRYYARVLGRPGAPIQCSGLDASGVRFAIGPHAVELIAPKGPDGPIAAWLRARGASPYQAALKGGARSVLDSAKLLGARLAVG